MANSNSARKRARQAEKHRGQNAAFRAMARTYIKNVVTAVEAGDKEKAQSAYGAAVPIIDKVSGKGLMHRNKAARHKSRLNTAIQKMA